MSPTSRQKYHAGRRYHDRSQQYLRIDSGHSTGGTVTATSGGQIALDEVGGDLFLDQVKSTGGNVFLTASGRIVDGRSGGNAPGDNVEAPAGLVVLSAGDGIGTLADNLLTSVGSIAAVAGTAVPVYQQPRRSRSSHWRRRAGRWSWPGHRSASLPPVPLIVNQNVLSAGAVALSAPTLVISGGTIVQSTDKSVTLTTTGSVTLQAGSRVSANAASGQVGIYSTGSTSSIINVSGIITASKAQIVTGAGDDAIYLYKLPVALPLSVDGGGGVSNSLYLPGTAGNDIFNVTSTAVTLLGVETVTYSNIQSLTLDAMAGNDVFNVTSSSASLGTTLQGSNSDTLNLFANNSPNAPVIFNGGSGPDSVFVTGNDTGGDMLVAAPNRIVSGSSLPGFATRLRRRALSARPATPVRQQYLVTQHHPAGAGVRSHRSGVTGCHDGAG